MPAPKIRADYEQLTQIAIAFARHAALTRQTLQHLRHQQDTLRGGDWQGEGAQAFQAEMDSQVAPRLNRLVQALEAANETTLQVRASMQAAEEEAARLLRANGAPNQAGAVGAAVSPAAGGNITAESQFDATAPNVHAWGPTGGAPGPTGTPPKVPPPTTGTTRSAVEDAVAVAGGLGTAISILESGGIIAEAGVGTTIGAFLLPVGAFLLGLKWAAEAEEREKRIAEFKTKMRADAIVTSQEILRHLHFKKDGTALPPFNVELNEEGKRELEALLKATDRSMNAEMNEMLKRDLFGSLYGSVKRPTEQEWQDLHDWYVEIYYRDMAHIYSQSKYRVDSRNTYESYQWWAITPLDRTDGPMVRVDRKLE